MTDSLVAELLDYRWASTTDLEPFIVHNPADGSELARIRPHSTSEIDTIVRTAAAAQPSWAARPYLERARYLNLAAERILENLEELAALESRENGKPLDQARGDVYACVSVFQLMAGAAAASSGESRTTPFSVDVISLVPYGVVGAIIPFNWPPIHTAGKVAPALAAGNAVVLKPGPQAPLAPTRIVDLISEVLPDDVVHVIHGGLEQGQDLVTHPKIRKVTFTGSPSGGRAVIQAAAQNYTPTLMELGGKDALIICDDVNLDDAVHWAVEGAFFNQGEACTAASRIVVQRSIHDAFMAKFNDAVSRLVVGDGATPGTQVGPVVTEAQRERVLGYIEIGRSEGAVVSAQGAMPDDPRLAGGFFVAPTVFDGVTPDMRIAQEEIFGPVAVVLTFEDDDEAVEIANGTEFGLIGGVLSGDTTRAIRIAQRLDQGMVLINNYNRMTIGSGFGGTKASGFGREHSVETVREYGYKQMLRIPSGAAPIPRWQAIEGIVR